MSGELLREDRDGVRLLTLNRPDKRNALTVELAQALLDAFEASEGEAGIGCVVLTGAAPAFCAGADLAEIQDPARRHLAERRSELNHRLQLYPSRMSKPVIAAVNGAAAGAGAAIALACDLLVIADTAKIGYPEVRHGLAPTLMIANLVRQVGRKAAFELLALGGLVDAHRAVALGLANRIVPAAELMNEAMRMAGEIARVRPPAMSTTKVLFYQALEMSLEAALEAGREAGRKLRAATP